MRKISKVGLVILGLGLIVSMPSAAWANHIIIDPATTFFVASGNQTSQSEIDTAIAPFIGLSVELYKNDVQTGESGGLAGSYNTVFANTATDPEDATITYVSGNIVGPTAFLLVKDGNAEPSWYLFNLTALFNWDGMHTLKLENFWIGKGAISHVALYGTSTVPPSQVPEPGVILLLGAGISTLVIFKRFRPLR